MKVFITTSSFADFSDGSLRLLHEAGISYEVNPHRRKITEDEAMVMLQGCVGVAAGTEPLTSRVMDALPDLKVISRCGSGMDNVDLKAAAKRGITVCNTPDGPTLAVAELILGYALALLRKLIQMDREMREGVWKKRMGNTLKGKKLGIIGFGRIGQAVASIFAPLGVEVAFNDSFVVSNVYRKMPVIELLAWADILTLHCSKSGGECSFFGAEQLAFMRPGSWMINASRGGILDEQVLYEMLKSGHLAGAAIDVFEQEPYDGRLKQLENVILTPHIGSYARESRIKMEMDTIKNLIEALNA